MDNQRLMETAVGIFVAIGLASLAMLAMQVSNISAISQQEGYEISARFDNIGSLKIKAPVKMAGVRIGRVVAVSFEQDTFEALVQLRINAAYNQLPTDTSAGIFTSGVLGESYVGLEAGAEEAVLKNNDEIIITQSAVILENLIGKILFDKASGDSGGD